MIAVMLGVTAVFLGMINVRHQGAEEPFRPVVEAHKEIERYHDIHSIIIDNLNTVLVA